MGARLGEANILKAIGSLEKDPKVALEAYQAAQKIYCQIGDRYSQGQNLCVFIADAHVALNQTEKAINSLQNAINIGKEIGVELLKDYAMEKLQSIQSRGSSTE